MSQRLTRSDPQQLIEFAPPERLGYFSCKYDLTTKSLTYHPDKSVLRYFISPCNGNHDVNLLAGFDGARKWGRSPPTELFLLRWIVENYNLATEPESPDFICHSRILRSILTNNFSNKLGWKTIAVKVGDSIIIDEVDTDARKSDLESQSYSENASSFSGFAYIEQSTRHLNGSRVTLGPGGTRDTFYTVNKSRIGNHSLLHSHGVDCIINKSQYKKPFNEMKFATLHTRSIYWNSQKYIKSWPDRSIRWWTESVVSGIDTIFCGEKRPGKLLTRIIGVNATTLPRNSPWSPNDCFQSLDSTLSLIKSVVVDELVPYSFHSRPKENPYFTKLNEPVESFIPRWFIDLQAPVDA